MAVVRYRIAGDDALVIRLASGAQLAFRPQTDLLRFDRVREHAMLAGLPLGTLTTKTWTAVVVDRVLKRPYRDRASRYEAFRECRTTSSRWTASRRGTPRLDTKVRRPKAVEFGPTFHRVNPVRIAAGCADPEG